MSKYGILCILGIDRPCQRFGGAQKRHMWKIGGRYLYLGGIGIVCWACGCKGKP